MGITPLQPARVSNLEASSFATQSINSTQTQLLNIENELSTGKQVNVPSDNPSSAAVIIQLQQTLQQQQVYNSNITSSSNQLGEVDNVLSSLNGLLQQAQTIASADVNAGVSASQRSQDAEVVQNLYTQALALANTQYNGSYLFGGDKDATAPYSQGAGGVQFVGGTEALTNQVDPASTLAFQVAGPTVFGQLSASVGGASANLNPGLTTQTLLSDLGGADGSGVSLGKIQVGNGTTSQIIDLSDASSVGDVVNAVNAAGVGGITAGIGANGNLTLTGAAGDDITVNEVSGDSTAEDLGIYQPNGAGAGVAVAGANLAPKVTALTPLAELRNGQGIDPSGIVIGNGATQATVSLASPPLPADPTVQDLLNAINSSGTGVQASVDPSGAGIDVVNLTQGSKMTIAENGGATGAELGLLTFTGSTPLSSLNNGAGVSMAASGADFTVTRSDGSTFDVSLAGASTVQDVVDKINAADTDNGTLPAKVVASVAINGQGITLTDNSGGSGALSVAADNSSQAAAQLGLTAGAGATVSGNSLVGASVGARAAGGIFTDLANLRDALTADDTGSITSAAQSLQADQQNVTDVRGSAGATSQELTTKQSQISSQTLATQTLLSSLQDVDYTTAITQYQQLQTTLQATLETSARSMQYTLLDFLS